jgi:predicted dehydrogenase
MQQRRARQTEMINAAIYGLGRWGRTLVDSVQGRSNVIRFGAAVVRTPGAHREFADAKGFLVTGDYETVLTDPSIDAVVLATRNSDHAGQVLRAAAAGKHVQVEKPFTLTKESAEAVAKACAEAHVTLAVAFNRRFRPAVIDFKNAVATGRIGEVLHVECQFSGPTFLRTPADSWRALRDENPAGGMSPRGIHALDLMIDAFGEVAEVCALSERRAVGIPVDDTTCMLLRFATGVTGYLSTIMATGDYWRVNVMGTKGWAELPTEHRLIVGDLDRIVEDRTYEAIDIEKAELECFARSLAGGPPFPVTTAQAIHGVAVHEAIARSAQEGGWVAVE